MSNTSAFKNLPIDLEKMAMIFDALPFAMHVYSLPSDAHILANLQYAKQVGFRHQEELIRIDYHQIAQYRKHCISKLGGDLTLEAAYQRLMEQANLETKVTQRPHRLQVCTLSPTGFIYIGIVQKIPILNTLAEVDAILTFSKDITTYFDLLDLYQLYKKHYTSGKQAIHQLLTYLSIQDCFRVSPTHRELLTLLVFTKDVRAKYTARQLELSKRTIEEYKARLRNKLKSSISLERLLLKLRSLFDDKRQTVTFDDSLHHYA